MVSCVGQLGIGPLVRKVSGMEDRVANKMKKFEKIMRNAAAASPCNVMLMTPHRTILP